MPKENTHNTVSRATTRSVNKSAISTIAAVILAVIITGSVVGGAVYAYFALQSAPAQQLVTQPKPALQKFKVSTIDVGNPQRFLVSDTAKDRGIFAKNGLDPEFVTPLPDTTGITTIKNRVESGVKIGFAAVPDLLVVRSSGVPIKIVAGFGGKSPNMIFVRADGTVKTVKDLDGKKVGVISDVGRQQVLYLSKKFGISPEIVPVRVENITGITSLVVALKLRTVDAFFSGDPAPLRLVDSGELMVLVRYSDIFPKPFVSVVIWATEDVISQDPELVRKFVKSWLEGVKFISENPDYAANLYIKRTNAPKDLAEKAVSLYLWTYNGRAELANAVTNLWQIAKESGAIPADINVKIEDAVDIRFLP